MTAETERVRVHSDGSVVRIELNRPEAINALSLDMVHSVDVALDLAESDPSIRAVVLAGAGERGFCAGGDVRQLYVDVSSGDLDAPREYFGAEYALNARIAEFAIPIVALMHGACMGGGVGLAGHASIRLVTDGSNVAMPETKIGFTPDVGGSWLLARSPGRLGERLGLHGQIMGPAEAIAAGFADLYIPAERGAQVPGAVSSAAIAGRDIVSAVAALAADPGQPDFGMSRADIDATYSLESVAEIISALRHLDPNGAAALERLSPTALEVTLRSVRSARTLSLREALGQEQILAEWFFTQRTDTLEGIRAVLVDKDHAPVWPPRAEDFPI